MPKRILALELQLRERLARNIRRLREENGWTQETVAAEARMHTRRLQHLEAGSQGANLMTIAQLAYALRIDPVELLRA